VGSVILWEYQNDGGGDNRVGNHARTIELRFNTEAEGSAVFSGPATTVTMKPVLTHEENVAQDLTFAARTCRYVEMAVTDNHYGDPDGLGVHPTIGGDRVGLGEVRFAAGGGGVTIPGKASVPDPDGTEIVNPNVTLQWNTGRIEDPSEPGQTIPNPAITTHIIYLGRSQTSLPYLGEVPAGSPVQAQAQYGPVLLDHNTTYYWRVDEYVNETDTIVGDIWSFTTAPSALERCSGFYLGDINTDCSVGPPDLELLAQRWLLPCSGYECGDLDEDADVDSVDFSVLANDWGKEISVVINEFLASNESGGIVDEDSTTSDWIELRNYSADPVNLDGWFLTDSKNKLNRWRIPAITLGAGEYRIVFASGKNRSDPAGELHTDFVLSIDGEYLALVRSDERTVEHKYTGVPIQYEDVSYGLALRPDEKLLTPNYFLAPTPRTDNGVAYPNLGPVIFQVTHTPERPADSDDLVIAAQVAKVREPVASVQLIYRVMYGPETTVPMTDDGSGADAAADDGVYTAVIPAGVSSSGRMVRYAVKTQDTAGGENRLPLTLDLFGKNQSPEYFGTVVANPAVTSELPIMEWFTTSKSASHSRTGARASVYYQGRFYDNIYVRQRGQATNAYSQKFDFNKGHDFYVNEKLGKVGEVNMNAKGADSAYIRQSLAFNTYEWCGTPSCESFLVLMQCNGAFDRVGVLIEQVDEDFLKRYGRDPDGALYKFIQRHGESQSTTDPRFYPYLPHTPCFSDTDNGIEKKIRRWEDFSDLQAVVDGLMSPTEDQRRRYVFDNFNLPEMISYLAGRAISNDCDDTRKNFYFYRDTNGTGEWEIYPWDNDFTFGVYGDGGPHRDHPFFGDEEHLKTSTKQWNLYFDVMFKLPETREMYLRHLRTMMDELLQPPGTPAGELKFEAICDQMVAPAQQHISVSASSVKSFFPSRRNELYVKYGPSGTEPLIPDSIEGSTLFTITDTLISGDPGLTQVEYFVPSDDSLGTTWTERDFPNSWDTGSTGIGYERRPSDSVNYLDLIQTDIDTQMSGRTSVYIRIPFTVANPADYDALVLYMKYDDGFAAYINGVALPGRNFDGNPVWNASANGSRSDSVCRTYEEIIVSASMLVAGRNVLAIQGLNNDSGSSDLLILPELKGAVNQVINPVVTDIDMDHLEYNPASGIQDQEYIRLVNNADVAIDISGWNLTGGVRFTFAPGTVIPSGHALYVSPNARAFRERTVSPKGNEGRFVVGPYNGHLSSWGETVELSTDNFTLIDTLTYSPDPSDPQRYLRITELMYHPAHGGAYNEEEYEYIELTNIGTEALSLDGAKISDGVIFAFGEGATIPPGEYRLLVKNEVAFESLYPGLSSLILGHYTGSLDNGGETIDLEDATNSTILQFRYNDWFHITDGGGFSLTIKNPNGNHDDWDRKSGWRTSALAGGSPGWDDTGIIPDEGTVIINEILAHSHDEASDWIELHNMTDQTVDIGGWFLSDSATDVMKYEVAEGTYIDPCDYIVFYQDPNFGVLTDPGTRTPFALSENGETVYLHVGRDGELMGFMDREDFGASETGVSFGRYVTSTGDDKFPPMEHITPRQPNAYPRVGPVVITEIMYHPTDPCTGDPYGDDDDFEYIELYNITGSPVTLQEPDNEHPGVLVPWRIRGVGFTFPAFTTIQPYSYLVIARNRSAFVHRYGTLSAGVLFALDYYDSKLDNSGESLQLAKPGDEDPNTPGYYYPIRVDRVEYGDAAPWPIGPDGYGYSLTRIWPDLYANDPNNWTAQLPSPGE